MRLALAGGGTGGHLAAGVALVESLRDVGGEGSPVFFTVPRSARLLERTLPDCRRVVVPAASISLRKCWRLPGAIFRNWRGYRRSRREMEREKAELLIGLGGYASVPPVLAAFRLGVPVVLFEQNTVLGRANRLLLKRSSRLALAFPLRKGVEGAVLTGSPLRRLARDPSPPEGGEGWVEKSEKFTILAIGGSSGARFINRLLKESIELLEKEGGALRLIHLAGREDEEEVRRAYRAGGIDGVVMGFCEQMGRVYRRADLVVGRAGGGTLGELAFWGLPSILIPYPWATDRHQLSNALYFESAGAAVVRREKEASPEWLVKTILTLMRDRERLGEMADRAKGLAVPNPEKKLIALLKEAAGGKRDEG